MTLEGLEPSTFKLKACCYHQLSYRVMLVYLVRFELTMGLLLQFKRLMLSASERQVHYLLLCALRESNPSFILVKSQEQNQILLRTHIEKFLSLFFMCPRLESNQARLGKNQLHTASLLRGHEIFMETRSLLMQAS